MNRLQANIILLIVAIIWGSTFVIQQVATGNLGAICFTSARFLLGSIVVLPLALIQLNRLKQHNQTIEIKDWFGMILTGLALFSGAVLQQIGIFYTSVTNAGFLTALYVPMVPVFAFFVFKKTIHWSVWPASFACLVGTFIMSGAENLSINTGDIWIIAGAFFWTIHVLLVGEMAQRTQAPLVVAFTQFLTCAVVGLISGFFIEHPQIADFLGAYKGILYAGILSVGIAFTLQVVAQRFTPAADTAIILSSETVFAALAGYIFIGERQGPGQLFGAGIILLSILSIQLVPLYKKHHRQFKKS